VGVLVWLAVGLAGGRYIALTSSSVTRMQSPVFNTNLP
jgi:hypothetical protein